MITVYSDRIKILSRGGLAPLQTKAGFFRGHSVPVNEKLSEIFLQLHISEKTGRGIPVISSEYGEGAFDFSDNDITVTIPFNFINEVGDKVGNKVGDKVGDKVGNKVGNKWVIKLKSTDSMTHKQEYWLKSGITQILRKRNWLFVCHLGRTSIDNTVAVLRKRGFIERIGSNKSGYWKAN